MTSSIELTPSVDSFTPKDLFQLAAALKGLEVRRNDSHHAISEPIKEYVLDAPLLAVLAANNIKQHLRPDCNGRVFTLADENPQQHIPGWAPSNYWNFQAINSEGRPPRFDLRIALHVQFNINTERRGIILTPLAYGTFVSAGDHLPNFRMFKALIDNDLDAPTVAKELAANDKNFIIAWTELGLGGLRTVSNLFMEFAAHRKAVINLGVDISGVRNTVFDPAPYQNRNDGDIFIAEPAQPRLFACWREQLKAYRDSLA